MLRTKAYVWLFTMALVAASVSQAVLTFGASPSRGRAPLLTWAFVALWLVIPLGLIHRTLMAPERLDPITVSIRLALLGYVPVTIVLRLLNRLLHTGA